MLATDNRASHNAIANREISHALAYGNNSSRHLVPDDNGRLYGCQRMRCSLRDIYRAAGILVQVGAADAAPGNLNLKLSGRWMRWAGHILNPNVLPGIPDRCFHQIYSIPPGGRPAFCTRMMRSAMPIALNFADSLFRSIQ
jgi:hypothetical protein